MSDAEFREMRTAVEVAQASRDVFRAGLRLLELTVELARRRPLAIACRGRHAGQDRIRRWHAGGTPRSAGAGELCAGFIRGAMRSRGPGSKISAMPTRWMNRSLGRSSDCSMPVAMPPRPIASSVSRRSVATSARSPRTRKVASLRLDGQTIVVAGGHRALQGGGASRFDGVGRDRGSRGAVIQRGELGRSATFNTPSMVPRQS